MLATWAVERVKGRKIIKHNLASEVIEGGDGEHEVFETRAGSDEGPCFWAVWFADWLPRKLASEAKMFLEASESLWVQVLLLGNEHGGLV